MHCLGVLNHPAGKASKLNTAGQNFYKLYNAASKLHQVVFLQIVSAQTVGLFRPLFPQSVCASAWSDGDLTVCVAPPRYDPMYIDLLTSLWKNLKVEEEYLLPTKQSRCVFLLVWKAKSKNL